MRKWSANSLLDCFVMCLGRLTYWITHKYIPNYFIPEHNMIDRFYDQQSWDELLALMSFLHGIGWQSILLCDSFHFFKMCRHLDNISLNGLRDFEKAIVPLINIGMELQLARCNIRHRKWSFYQICKFHNQANITKEIQINVFVCAILYAVL